MKPKHFRLIPNPPRSSYEYRKRKEFYRARNIGTSIKKSTNSRKVPYTTEYELRRDKKEKEVIDEINRRNLSAGYNV